MENDDPIPKTQGLPDAIPEQDRARDPGGCLVLSLFFGVIALFFSFNLGYTILTMGFALPLMMMVAAIPTVALCAICAVFAHRVIEDHWSKARKMPLWFLIGFVPPLIFGLGLYTSLTVFTVGVSRYVINHWFGVPFLVFFVAFGYQQFIFKSFFIANSRDVYNGRGAPFMAGTVVQVVCIVLFFVLIFRPNLVLPFYYWVPMVENLTATR